MTLAYEIWPPQTGNTGARIVVRVALVDASSGPVTVVDVREPKP